MVNGKPSLILGNNEGMASLQPKSGFAARSGTKSPLAATPEFASFLPGADNAVKSTAPAAKGGQTHTPRRCPACRAAKRGRRA